MAFASVINAPWSVEQVANLSEYQSAGFMHPYTCGECGENLVAGSDGWSCPNDTYTQRWAHGFTADREWLDSMRVMMDRLNAGQFTDED